MAVLPEAEDVEVDINPNDIRVDVFCSSGPGGQSVNTTQSAVRLTHIPTGLVVSCQDEKSQHKNKDKAMRVLRARLLELKQAEHDAEIAGARKNQVGSGDRSERIRTYNFPQSRVSDHRINLTLNKLEAVLDGELDEIIGALITMISRKAEADRVMTATWTVGRVLQWTAGYFRRKGLPEPRLEAEILLAHVLGWERVSLYVNYDQPMNEEERARYRQIIKRRVQGEPVAYLVGYKEFFLEIQGDP